MKDLYTFDLDHGSAMKTYEEVRAAYSTVFSRLQIPMLVVEASCGDMGGSKSHEYHIPSPLGEDNIIRCGMCDYSANEEIAEVVAPRQDEMTSSDHSLSRSAVNVWRGISTDRRTLVNAWYPSDGTSAAAVNVHTVKALVPDIDASIEDVTPLWADAVEGKNQVPASGPLRLVNLFDSRLSSASERILQGHKAFPPMLPVGMHSTNIQQSDITTSPQGRPLNLMRIRDGDQCPRCSSRAIEVVKTLELGHAFHLGDRYSAPIKAMVTVPPALPSRGVGHTSPMQMGCYGIGITRIMGAVANALADGNGLKWPVSIAPYEVAIVPDKNLVEEAFEVYDLLTGMTREEGGSTTAVDMIMDDRAESLGWKLKDADLTGYPIVVVVGRAWRQGRSCEVQCRGLSIKETVPFQDVPNFIAALFSKL